MDLLTETNTYPHHHDRTSCLQQTILKLFSAKIERSDEDKQITSLSETSTYPHKQESTRPLKKLYMSICTVLIFLMILMILI